MKLLIFITAVHLICIEAFEQPVKIDIDHHRPAIYEPPHYRAPIYEPPVYKAPNYEPPFYKAPRYENPLYLAPFYQPASYKAPHYEPASYKAPDYEPPRYRAPDYEPANYNFGPEHPPPSRPVYTEKILHRLPLEHQVTDKIFHKSKLSAAPSEITLQSAPITSGAESVDVSHSTTEAVTTETEEVFQQPPKTRKNKKLYKIVKKRRLNWM